MKLNVLPLVALASLALPAYAHHSFGMFEMTKNVGFEGEVLQYNWENPHSHLVIKVPADAKDQSTVGTWDIELQSVNIMSRQGWNRSTYKVGDHAVLVAHPMRDGSKGASVFYAVMPDGRRLYGDIARPVTDTPAPSK